MIGDNEISRNDAPSASESRSGVGPHLSEISPVALAAIAVVAVAYRFSHSSVPTVCASMPHKSYPALISCDSKSKMGQVKGT